MKPVIDETSADEGYKFDPRRRIIQKSTVNQKIRDQQFNYKSMLEMCTTIFVYVPSDNM